MGLVSFTARRSLMPGRTAGDSVVLSVDFTDAIRRREIRKYVHRASAGNMETLYEGADTIWDLELAPAFGDTAARIREFVDSTALGEAFSVWAYGTESAPVTVKRFDRGYAPSALIRVGRDDPRSIRITVLEQ